jgi:ribosomal protein S18 acetylase RimI-like enzyme
MCDIISLDDPQLITGILNCSFLTVAKTFGYTAEQVPSFPAFIESGVIVGQLQEGFRIFGAKIDNAVVGCVGYKAIDGTTSLIERLAVLPEYRHRGIGKYLLEYIENIINRNKGKFIELSIVDNNSVLKNWYKRLGYCELRIEEYPQLPFKVCVLQKRLIKNKGM